MLVSIGNLLGAISNSGVNWQGISLLSSADVNWDDFAVLSNAGVNWDDIRKISTTGVNWNDLNVLSKSGINWNAIGELSTSNVNWQGIDVLSYANVSWYGVSQLSNSGVNFQNFSEMSNSGINWSDVTVESRSGINWADVGSESHGGVNWLDLGVSSTAGINWGGINTLISNMSTVFNMVGTQDNAQTQGTDTLVHLLNTINAQTKSIGSSSSVTQILSSIQSVQNFLGSTTNSSETVLGDIQAVKTLLGNATDESTTSLFGVANTASSNASAAQSYAQQIINDLGVNGATPTAYGLLKNLQDAIQNIQDSVTQLTNGTNNAPALTQDTIDKLTAFLNDQAKQAGLEKTLGVQENFSYRSQGHGKSERETRRDQRQDLGLA